MKAITFALALAYIGYGFRLASFYYNSWKRDASFENNPLMFLILFPLCAVWPVTVPISYLELLRTRQRTLEFSNESA